ncbi:MAG: hypothetical protein WAV07_09625 [Candidatus Contendobacter sp.]
MIVNRLPTVLTFCLPLVACGAAPAPSPDGPGASKATNSSAPDISGHWVSQCVKVSEQQIMKLDFQITKDTWTLDYTTFADPACQTKFLTVHIEGPYEMGNPAASIKGAFEGKFGFTKKTVTPHIDAAVGFLGSDKGCGGGSWTVGAASDVLKKGCAGLGQRPGITCSADYDLVYTDGNTLTFGARPTDNNMCTADKRPVALSKLSMKRVP